MQAKHKTARVNRARRRAQTDWGNVAAGAFCAVAGVAFLALFGAWFHAAASMPHF